MRGRNWGRGVFSGLGAPLRVVVAASLGLAFVLRLPGSRAQSSEAEAVASGSADSGRPEPSADVNRDALAEPAEWVEVQAQLGYCVALLAEGKRAGKQPDALAIARAAACLRGVATRVRRGIEYQRCLWGLSPSSTRAGECAPAAVRPSAVHLEARQAALNELDALASTLERAALGPGSTAVGRVEPAWISEAREQVEKVIDLLAREQSDFTLISQGGVSLGSWQAGYTYYLTEVMKRRRQQLVEAGLRPTGTPAFRTLTGASAGSVNSLIGGVEGCREQRTPPKASLYYTVWVKTLGLYRNNAKGEPAGLVSANGEETHRHAIFSSKPIQEAMDAARAYLLSADTVPGCSFNFGFVTTYMDPVQAPVHCDQHGKALVSAPRLTERFALRVTPNDPVRGLVIENVEAPSARPFTIDPKIKEQTYYAKLGRGGVPSLDDLVRGVQASSAFPVAFPPVDLALQRFNPELGKYEDIDTTFVDGGTLDNTPIGLAARVNAWTEQRADNPWIPDLSKRTDAYVFVNPGVTDWVLGDGDAEPVPATNKSLEEDTLLDRYLGFLTTLLDTSTNARLVATAEELPFMREDTQAWYPRLLVPKRTIPIFGDELMHFMAFLEEDFRRFDYFAGIADAELHLSQFSGAAKGDDTKELKNTSKAFARTLETEFEYRCLNAYYAVREGLKNQSLNARSFPRSGARDLDGACHAGSDSGHRNFRAMLAAMHNFKRWLTSSTFDERERIGQFFDLLAEQQFEFKQFQTYGEPKIAFRELLAKVINQVAEKHSSQTLQWSAIKVGGRALADTMTVREFPSPLSIGFVRNGVEVGFGRRLRAYGNSFGIRLDARLKIVDVINPDRPTDFSGAFGPTIVIGLSGESPGFFDLEFGPRAFYATTRLPGQDTDYYHAWGPGFELMPVLLQRVYVGFDVRYFREGNDPWARAKKHGQEAGFAGNSLGRDDLRWSMSAGYRWLF